MRVGQPVIPDLIVKRPEIRARQLIRQGYPTNRLDRYPRMDRPDKDSLRRFVDPKKVSRAGDSQEMINILLPGRDLQARRLPRQDTGRGFGLSEKVQALSAN